MALDPNIGRIKFLRSKTVGRKPTTADIAEGELALNLVDRTIYTRNGNNIVDMGFGLGGSVNGNIDQVAGTIRSRDTITGDVLVQSAALGITGTTGEGKGLSLYPGFSGGMPSYGMFFGVSSKFGGHGAVAGDDWATYFTMNSGPNRGWIFKHGTGTANTGNVASISATGIATFSRVDAPLNGNANSATVLQTERSINGVGFDGSKNIAIPGYFDVVSQDNRLLRPKNIRNSAMGVYFTSISGLNTNSGTDWADFLSLNTYHDSSGQLVNGLAFPKSGKANPIHYRAEFGANEWGAGRTLAYIDDDSLGNSATATRLAQSTRIATGADVAWYRIGKVTIPQTGRTFTLRMYGGGGYNGEPSQSSPATLMLKTGNGANKLASVSLDVVDGTSYPGAVAVLQLDALNFEVFVQFKSYSTFNYIPEIETGTTFDPQWSLYPVLPGGAITGQVRVLAQTTSNVASATKLQTPHTINGIAFDGTSDILIQDNHSILMPRGANFDDYQGPGSYYCPVNIDAETMLNRPMDGAFSLEVKLTAGVVQKYTHYETARCFVRKSYNTWGPWREVALLNLENTFTRSQIINGGDDSILRLVSSRESAIVFQKPTRRVVLTLASDNTFGLYTGSGWMMRSINDQTMDFFANVGIAAGFKFMLEGAETDNITRRQNPNAAITINSPEPGMASIRNTLEFNWYADTFQIGAIRSGSQTSHGFGITKGNNDLLWRVDPQGAMYTGPILGREYIDVQGNSTATQMISRSGRFSAPNSAYHYIDVGQDGRNITSIGQRSGAFEFRDTTTNIVSFSFGGGAGPIVSNNRMVVSSDTWTTTVLGLGTGDNSAINTTEQFIPVGQTGYNALLAGKVMSTGAGYRTNVSIGVYRGSNNWSNSGAYIAVGGSDASPTESFHFNNGGYFGHSSGHIEIYSDLWLQNGNIRTNSAELQILTTGGDAKRIATGGVLASDSYADMVNVPNLGIYSKGDIRTPLWMYAAKFAGNVDAPNRVDIIGAPGGGTNNGLRAGPMDAALFAGCNLDIQTHNGLGIIDNTGARRIVFEARTGTIHCKGSVTAPAFSGALTGNAATATKLATARTINGVAFNGTTNITIADSTKLPLTGGTINGDLIVNRNETVKGNLTVEGLTADRFGLHDKMHWVGASVKPYGTSALTASVTTNTFQVIIRGESGAKYWTKGRTKLHFIINHANPQNARFVTATVTDWSTTDSNKQTIMATLSLVNHAMPLNTVFHWVGSTYESFGCDWAGWMNSVGDSRLVMRLKPTTPLKSLAPIITSSCSSDVYWNASQLPQPGVEPQQRNGMGSIVINSVHEGDVVFAIGDNNTDGSASNEYVSISVKDFV